MRLPKNPGDGKASHGRQVGRLQLLDAAGTGAGPQAGSHLSLKVGVCVYIYIYTYIYMCTCICKSIPDFQFWDVY